MQAAGVACYMRVMIVTISPACWPSLISHPHAVYGKLQLVSQKALAEGATDLGSNRNRF